jgi:hypothetical protein
MAALTLPAAAEALGISSRALRRMIDNDAPVARAGGRGRGNSTLVDPDAIRAWIDSSSLAPAHDSSFKAFASRIPEIIAHAMWDVFVDTEGPHKRAAARTLIAAWYLATAELMDAAGAPELSVMPEKIDRLRAIFE